MTFLKKLGTVVLKIIGIASGLMPLISNAIPTSTIATAVEDKLTSAFNVIITAEQMYAASSAPGVKTGSAKLAAATPFIAALVQGSEHLVGKTPKNPVLFSDASTRLTAALADILNSFGE